MTKETTVPQWSMEGEGPEEDRIGTSNQGGHGGDHSSQRDRENYTSPCHSTGAMTRNWSPPQGGGVRSWHSVLFRWYDRWCRLSRPALEW